MSLPLSADPDEAVRLLPPHARVLTSPGCATAATLLAALGRAAATDPGRTVVGGLLLGDLPWTAAVRDGSLGLRTWHASGAARLLVDDGTADYVPMRLGDVAGWLRGHVDAMVVRVTPPGADGMCSIGPSGSYTMAGIAAVRAAGGLVLGEIDPDLPRTSGPTGLPVDLLNATVDVDEATRTYRGAEPTGVHRRIAEAVMGLLPSRPTVQLGIGAVPEAVTGALAGLRPGSLRLVGMASDGLAALLDAGVLAAPVTAVEVLGGRALLDMVDRNPSVEVHPSSTVHDPRWIGRHPRFVSVNSALEVDLTGQVALEAAGGRSLAGLGGAVDFFEGAHLSHGGLRVVALQATGADGGTKIVARLAAGVPVSLPRHSVDVVVTEHGVADLRGASTRERAERLIGVAAPEHRDALAEAT